MGAVIKTIPQISQSHLSFDVVNANLVIIFTLVAVLESLGDSILESPCTTGTGSIDMMLDVGKKNGALL